MRNPTAADIAQLQDRWRTGRKLKKPTESERSIQDKCIKLLELDGWRCVITDPPWMRGLAVTEKGIADTLGIRYKANATKIPDLYKPWAQILWVEWKKITGKHSQLQHDWHALERARGALTWKADEDFEPSVEGFLEHYNASGLAIKRLRMGAQL